MVDTSEGGRSPGTSTDNSHDAILVELNTAKYELATLKQERELEKLGTNQEIYNLQKRAQEDGKALEQERSEKNFLFERHQTLLAELEAVRQGYIDEKINLERLLRDAQTGTNILKERIHDLETELNTLQRSAKREIDELKLQIQRMNEHATSLQFEISTQRATLQQCQVKLQETENELFLSQKEGDCVKTNPQETEVLKMLKRELADQLNHVKFIESRNRKLESENEELRSYSKNISVVEEEKRSLESKVHALDGLREKVSNLELQKAILEEERTSWTAFLQDDPDGIQFSSPAHLARAYMQAKIEKNALLERFGRPDPAIQQRNKDLEALVSQNVTLEEEIQSLKRKFQKDTKEKQRLERQKDLALKEANFLREQLKTYSTEEMVMMAGNYDDQKSRRIEELEGILEAHKTEIHALTKQLLERDALGILQSSQQLPPTENMDPGIGRRFEQKIEDLEKDLESAQKAHRLASIEIKALQKQVLAAETTSRMRVLQLKDNPTARHEATKAEALKTLRDENIALLAQLEGKPGGAKLVPFSTLERSRLDLKEMETLIAEKEKRMLRLKEMWSKKALEFRQAVHSLLGYEVDFQPNGRVKITSMFHRSDLYGGVDTGIVFDGEQGTMKLCGGPNSQFAREIRNQLKFYVEERKEIPCFLAALTMEGYEKTTRAQH
ncbi:hypothetical protein H072_4101 [Dactylellina haptotyla CBS 200.50]|uniref:Spindle assembly checkpoint component MAD1 n=1 Tax=Dactylellina haptotyla (strain CBS 200.50) TaxID=1284197 RepID=S8ALH4_DACHA|nr:hypothetical protein H072_4101 [Dactylellina haptotyla CBS 200.50]